jgi:hypothetical protein
MTSEDSRVLDLDQNVAACHLQHNRLPDDRPQSLTGRDANIRHEAAMTFEEWRKESKQILMVWHDDDPECVDKDHWRQCFDQNYRPREAARYAAELLRLRATAPVAKR